MAKSNANTATDDKAQELEKTGGAATNLINDLKGKAHDLQEKAEHLREEATTVVKEKYAKIKGKSAEVEAKVVDYTKKNPIKTIGFAVAAGAILARLFRSRK